MENNTQEQPLQLEPIPDELTAGETAGQPLLAEYQDFLITENKRGIGESFNVTYRMPRKSESEESYVVATTTIDTTSLNNLRVETIDDQFFIINDSNCSLDRQTRFRVQSEKTGHDIVSALVQRKTTQPSEKVTDNRQEPIDDLGLNKKYWRLNKITVEFAPLIFTTCAVLLSVSASLWLVFH